MWEVPGSNPNEDKNLPLKKNMDSPRKDINNRHWHLNTSLKKGKKINKKMVSKPKSKFPKEHKIETLEKSRGT